MNVLRKISLTLMKKKAEIINNKILHNKNDYPIYPFDSDDPEGFYANIFNYLYNRNKLKILLIILNIYMKLVMKMKKRPKKELLEKKLRNLR